MVKGGLIIHPHKEPIDRPVVHFCRMRAKPLDVPPMLSTPSEMIAAVHQPDSSELSDFLEKAPSYVQKSWSIFFQKDRMKPFVISSMLFSVDISGLSRWSKAYPPGTIALNEDEMLKLLVYQLYFAVKRLDSIVEVTDKNYQRIYFKKGKEGMNTMGACVDIGVGGLYPYLLAKFATRPDFHRACLDIQSQYYHERIHGVRMDLDDDPWELVPSLGEFLFEPKNNPRNVYVYGSDGWVLTDIRKILKKCRDVNENDIEYASSFRRASKLLIWEYRSLTPTFEVPSGIDAQLELVGSLSELYRTVPTEIRDQVLFKYIGLNRKELKDTAATYGKGLNLLY